MIIQQAGNELSLEEDYLFFNTSHKQIQQKLKGGFYCIADHHTELELSRCNKLADECIAAGRFNLPQTKSLLFEVTHYQSTVSFTSH